MADSDWPYDADQHDPLAKLRIPVVSNPYPGWAYAVCLVINEGEDALFPSLRPDEAETRQLSALLGFWVHQYTNGRAAREGKPFDIDADVNTLTLRKYHDNGWGFRLRTWGTSTGFAPEHEAPMTLEALTGLILGSSPEWRSWKASHPEAFGKAASRG